MRYSVYRLCIFCSIKNVVVKYTYIRYLKHKNTLYISIHIGNFI